VRLTEFVRLTVPLSVMFLSPRWLKRMWIRGDYQLGMRIHEWPSFDSERWAERLIADLETPTTPTSGNT
jgi:hypothetical protein